MKPARRRSRDRRSQRFGAATRSKLDAWRGSARRARRLSLPPRAEVGPRGGPRSHLPGWGAQRLWLRELAMRSRRAEGFRGEEVLDRRELPDALVENFIVPETGVELIPQEGCLVRDAFQRVRVHRAVDTLEALMDDAGFTTTNGCGTRLSRGTAERRLGRARRNRPLPRSSTCR